MKKYSLILTLALLTNPVHALDQGSHKKMVEIAFDEAAELAEAAAFEKDWSDKHPATEYTSLAATSLKTPVRVPASNENIVVAKDLTQLKNDLLSKSTGDQLNDYIEKTVKPGYETYSPEAQLVASQLIEFSVMRGFIFKMVPLIDKQKMAHSFLLTFVMRLADSISIYFPYQQWNAAFEFISEPYPGIVRFHEMHDLQKFMGKTLYQAVSASDIRLRHIPITEKGLVWDNTIFRSNSSYPDSFDRYVYVQEAERYALLAAKQHGMARMKFFAAYHLEDFFAIANDLSKMQTEEVAKSMIGGLFDSNAGESYIQGVSPKDRVDKINNIKDYPKFGDLMDTTGAAYVKHSLRHYQQMVSDLDTSWRSLDSKKTEAGHVFIQRGYADIFNRRANQVLPTWLGLMAQTAPGQIAPDTVTTHPVTVTSHLEGTEKNPEKVTVDLIGFFNNPPKKLRALLPVDFAANGKAAVWKTKGAYKYHNYFRGVGTAWSYGAYSVLFPDLKLEKVKSGERVKSFQRILSQSWGGGFIGAPLSMFVF